MPGLLLGAQAARADFALKPGDRVVFYGDSITDQRLYTALVETFVVTRFPTMPISFVHSGWGGDKVSGGNGGPIEVRLERDVLAYNPTVVTIMLGMNDGFYKPFDPKIFDAFSSGYTRITDDIRKQLPKARLTLLQPSPYDDVTREPTFAGGYNGVLGRYSQFIREVAARNGHLTADLNTPVVAMLQKAQALNPNVAAKIIPDRVHPGPGGHLIMAQALLQAWGAPSVVTDVEVNASVGIVIRAENTRLANFRAVAAAPAVAAIAAVPATPDSAAVAAVPAVAATRFSVTWTQIDGSLPLPLDLSNPVVALAVSASDVIESIDRQPLRITGLAPGRYTLKIDGARTGEFSAEQLGAGINLAVLYTPMRLQSAQVHKLTMQHNDQHFFRWRSIQVPLLARGAGVQRALPALLRALDEEEAQTIALQRRAAQPLLHSYELTTIPATPPAAPPALP